MLNMRQCGVSSAHLEPNTLATEAVKPFAGYQQILTGRAARNVHVRHSRCHSHFMFEFCRQRKQISTGQVRIEQIAHSLRIDSQ